MLRICLKLILDVCGFIVYLSMLLTNPLPSAFRQMSAETLLQVLDPQHEKTTKYRDRKIFYIIYIFCRNRDGMPL